MAHLSIECLLYFLPESRAVTAQELVDRAAVLWEEGGEGNREVAHWLVAAAEALVARGDTCNFGRFSRAGYLELFVAKFSGVGDYITARAGSMARLGPRDEAIEKTMPEWERELSADRSSIVFERVEREDEA